MLLENKDTIFSRIGKPIGYVANMLLVGFILTLILGSSRLLEFNSYAFFASIVIVLALFGKVLRKYLRW